MSDSLRDVIGKVLPQSWSQNKRDTLADEVEEALDNAGMLAPERIEAVEVATALMPVETVEAYGLTIKLDAMGEASEISHRDGLVVTG